MHERRQALQAVCQDAVLMGFNLKHLRKASASNYR